jgi:hypothetical protein
MIWEIHTIALVQKSRAVYIAKYNRYDYANLKEHRIFLRIRGDCERI